MKRLPFLLITSFALMSVGCEEDAPEVETAPPDTVTGYRGELDGDEPAEPDPQTEEPESTVIVVDPDPAATPPPVDITPPHSLDETESQSGSQQGTGGQQPGQKPNQPADEAPADEEPAVEEAPADSLPEGAATGSEQGQNGSGS